MIAGLKPYPEYKASGLPWLNGLAPGWRILRGKVVFSAVDVRSETGKEELLTVSASNGVRPRSQQSVTMFMAKSYVGHKLCWPGDLVVNSLWAWMQGLGVAHHHGLISSAYSVYRARREFADYSRFFHYLLRSAAYKWELQTRSKGVWTSRLQLLDQAFMDMPIVLPKPDEQAAIVRFLDHANWRIEQAIQAKKKLIALLNEQRQAIIHRAVTRGLDPNVRLKPSGIPWLDQMPEHWSSRKIKFIVSTVGGMTPNKGVESFWGGRIPWVSPKDMKVQEIVDSRDHITDSALRQTSVNLIAPPAVLIVVRGMILARTFPTAVTAVPVTVNQDMKALLPNAGISANYLVSLFTGIQRELLRLVEIAGHGTCCLRTDSWENFVLPMPPVNEQEAICEFLTSELKAVTDAIDRTEREIGLLREYRMRLTADVVTGKLDVRHAANWLPTAETVVSQALELEADDSDEMESDNAIT